MTEYDVNYETDLRRKYLTPSALEKFDRWLNEIRAEAWDEGFTEGVNDVYLHEDTSWAEPCIPNPYRNSAK